MISTNYQDKFLTPSKALVPVGKQFTEEPENRLTELLKTQLASKTRTDFRKCYPRDNIRHPEDIRLYENADGKADRILYTPISMDGRCDSFLIFRSEDEDINQMPVLTPIAAANLIHAHRVFVRTVSSVDDICRIMNKAHQQGAKIAGIIIDGHGDPSSLTLSSKKRNKITTFTEFPAEGCLHHLEPTAPIILFSCSTGGNGIFNTADTNLANSIAKQNPQHPVIASKEPINTRNLHIRFDRETEKLNIHFNKKFSDVTYLAYQEEAGLSKSAEIALGLAICTSFSLLLAYMVYRCFQKCKQLRTT